MSVIECNYLRAALGSDSMMLRKLHDFVLRHGLVQRPALVIQAAPVDEQLELNVRCAQYAQILQAGSGTTNSDWGGFVLSGSRVSQSFHGIELISYAQQPVWASEIHTDGHVIAGTWGFPDFSDPTGGNYRVVPFWYSEIFQDFSAIVGNVMSALASRIPFNITATLWRASELRFAAQSYGNNYRICPATPFETLQWRVRRAADLDELNQVAALMAADLLGAIGDPAR